MYCNTGPVKIPATVKLTVLFRSVRIGRLLPATTPSLDASESGIRRDSLLAESWEYTSEKFAEFTNVYEMMLGKTAGSTARIPMLLVPLFPITFAGRCLG